MFQAPRAPLSQIPGRGEDGRKPFTATAVHIVGSSITSEQRNPRSSALTRSQTRTPRPGRASALLLPSSVHHAIQNTGKCLFSGGKEKKYIAALLCLLLARGMFGTCDIMKLQSTAKSRSPSSKLKGRAGWLQPASSRAPWHPGRPAVRLSHRPAAGALGHAGSHPPAAARAAAGHRSPFPTPPTEK